MNCNTLMNSELLKKMSYERFKMAGTEHKISEKVANDTMTNVTYSALAYLKELETRELIIPEDFFQ